MDRSLQKYYGSFPEGFLGEIPGRITVMILLEECLRNFWRNPCRHFPAEIPSRNPWRILSQNYGRNLLKVFLELYKNWSKKTVSDQKFFLEKSLYLYCIIVEITVEIVLEDFPVGFPGEISGHISRGILKGILVKSLEEFPDESLDILS